MKISTIVLTIALMSGATTAISQQPAMPQQQQQTEDVSDQELKQFANVYMEVQTESQKMQKKAVSAIEESGMEVERFNELANAQNDPQTEVEANAKEEEKLTAINARIQEIQADFQGKVSSMIQKEGLTVQRYQEVYAAIQQDQGLQKKFGEMING